MCQSHAGAWLLPQMRGTPLHRAIQELIAGIDQQCVDSTPYITCIEIAHSRVIAAG